METSKTRVTAEEFFELPETTQPTELLNGEIIVSPSPLHTHQRIQYRISFLMGQRLSEVGGEVLNAPMDVQFDDLNVVQPDVLWRSENSRCLSINDQLLGPPELIVEILSPSNSYRDRREKFRLYERHGVPEYWIVSPIDQLIELWHLVDGKYQRIDLFRIGDTMQSPQLGAFVVAECFPQS